MNSDISSEQVQSPHLAPHLLNWGYIYPQTTHICISFSVSEGVMCTFSYFSTARACCPSLFVLQSTVKARSRTLLFSISHAHFAFPTNQRIAVWDHAGKKIKNKKQPQGVALRTSWEKSQRPGRPTLFADLNRFSSQRQLIRCPWMFHSQEVVTVLFIWYSASVAIFLLPPTTAA